VWVHQVFSRLRMRSVSSNVLGWLKKPSSVLACGIVSQSKVCGVVVFVGLKVGPAWVVLSYTLYARKLECVLSGLGSLSRTWFLDPLSRGRRVDLV